jgi:hypothetical protein
MKCELKRAVKAESATYLYLLTKKQIFVRITSSDGPWFTNHCVGDVLFVGDEYAYNLTRNLKTGLANTWFQVAPLETGDEVKVTIT